MNFKNLLYCILFLCFSASAQDFELGKVSVAELEQKHHPKDSTAIAAVLFEESEVSYPNASNNYYYTKNDTKKRIKIYAKEGLCWANIYQYAYNGLDEKIEIYNAYTYNLVDGKIIKTKLEIKEGFFKEKYNDDFTSNIIAMPNVNVGSVIEFNLIKIQNHIVNPPTWKFQENIPVNYSKFTTSVPDFVTFKTIQRGFIFPKITVNTKNSNNNRNLITQTNYIAKDLPAIKTESFVNNIDNYTASISHYLSVINNYGSYRYIADNWEDVVKSIYNSETFKYELIKESYFKEELNDILKNSKTKEDKIQAIHNFVKTKVTWNQYRGIYCGQGVKKAFVSKTGNVAEINLMLTAMLRYAGFNSNPVLISTRENGVTNFPTASAFDYVIAAIEEGEKIILLDATEKYSSPDILPLRDLNWFGRLVRDDLSSKEIEVMPTMVSNNKIQMTYVVGPNKSAEGKIRIKLFDYNAMEKRIAIANKSKEENIKNREETFVLEINELETKNSENIKEPLEESFSFADDKNIEIVDNKIYLLPLLFLTEKTNPFKQEERLYPIDFAYPKQDVFYINIAIPDGYVVEYIPASLNITSSDGLDTFQYELVTIANSIQVSLKKTIKNAIVPAENYAALKEFYQKMIEKQNEKIVLKRL